MGFVKESEEVLIIDGGAVSSGSKRWECTEEGENGERRRWLLSLRGFLNIRLHENVANYRVNAKEIRSITEI